MSEQVHLPPPLIRVSGVEKSFGGVKALDAVGTEIRAGVVHGLVGANGAGKSTLIRCLAGVSPPDAGTIEVDGHVVDIDNPETATGLGLAFIHQEMSLIPRWDVMRNMALGTSPATRLGIIDWRETREKAKGIAQLLGLKFPLSVSADSLGPADRALVMIGRALMLEARMIAMDEPTASLSAAEADRLHEIIRDLVAHGQAVVFVSHRLDEVADLCRDITVFKDGKVTKRVVDGTISRPELVHAIVGRDLELRAQGRPPRRPGRVVLEAEDVQDVGTLRGVTLDVHAGEVVGLGGLVGSGRTEFANIVYGAGRRTAGQIRLNGRTVRFQQPSSAVRAGVGLVPEERRSQGLFLDKSIDFNVNIATLGSLTAGRGLPFLHLRDGRRRAQKVADSVRVKARDVGQPVGSLSGGNQQKVAVARWLIDPPDLLILDEPSRGVDVGARAELHAVVREIAARGTAVLAISSDNEELVSLCDRVLVLADGQISGELSGESLTEEHLVHLSFEHRTTGAPTS